MSDGLAGLVLAAGEGRRMGMPKGLVTLGGEPLVERAASTLAAAGCDPVVVVVGARGADVAAALRTPVLVVDNEEWETGMGSSLRAGLAALPERARAVAIVLVDQPGITAEAVRRLADAWRSGAAAAVATYGGGQRNPVVLDRALWASAAADAVGDAGARRYLRRNPSLVTEVPCDDVADPADLDHPDDLAALRRTQEEPCN